MINTITKHRNTEQLSWHTRSAATNRDALKSDVTTRVKSSVNKSVNRGMKETAEINFCGLSPSNQKAKISNWFYNSKSAKTILTFARKKQLVFGATFSLFLTCILRPASIMVLPSKKNKEDQKYASAHSIASGVIGFAISNVAFLPLENAIQRLKDNPKDFIKNYKNSKLIKMEKEKYRLNDIAETYLGRLGDLAGSIPKGILTIALIPPILKYCFGYEKKKSQDKKSINPVVDYSLLNFKSHKNNKQSYFAGGLK